MNENQISRYIVDTFDDVKVTVANGDSFFSYDPEQKFPFATLVTSDFNDTASDLNRPSVYRLNIGVSRESYQDMFGPHPTNPGYSGIVATGHDFTALDQIMPHPVYAPMSWVCVLNPSAETFEKVVKPLLEEAYALDVKKHKKAHRATE